ncbi:type II toxin-antitoxin system HicA family toxin [Candidatus Poribacteria bacterium]|nr:type II toxin-antitoxin system HicA family toxin [Candidatus Poribacteria bacterium]
MRRRALIKHLREHGCYFIREGGRHSRWGNSVQSIKASTSVPRHNEISESLVAKICKDLKIPRP